MNFAWHSMKFHNCHHASSDPPYNYNTQSTVATGIWDDSLKIAKIKIKEKNIQFSEVSTTKLCKKSKKC